MGLFDKLKTKVKEQGQRLKKESRQRGTSQTGDRTPNKVRGDNINKESG